MTHRIRRALMATACAIAAIAVVPALASANVQGGASSWQWGNPLPQGNSLRDIAFTGTTGYAVGDFGTILKTTDDGANWTGLPSGTFTGLSRIQIAADGSIFAGGGCVLRVSKDGGATFQRVAFQPSETGCAENLAAFSFQSATSGYIVLANGTVEHTTDGGASFSEPAGIPGTAASSTGGSATPTDIWFMADGLTGFAATTGASLYETTDGAQTWHLIATPGQIVTRITFVDSLHGFAVGNAGLFLTTSDGGTTWTVAPTGTSESLTGIRCATALACLASTSRGDIVLRTIDGGATFTQPIPPIEVNAVAIASATQAVAVGNNGGTATSIDGGVNFATVGGRLPSQYTRLRAGGQANTAYAVGANGAFAVTTNGGASWTPGKVSTAADVADLSFPTPSAGWALDSTGALFKTANAGQSWSPIDTGSIQRATAIYAPSATTVYVIGPRGIRRTTDGGESFTSDGKINRIPLTDVERAGASAAIAYGPTFVLETTDGGKTWVSLHKPGTYHKVGTRLVNNLPIRSVDFVSAKVGYLLDTSGRLWATTNDGKTWKEIVSTGTANLDGMAWSSQSKGYLVATRFGSQAGPGFLLRTTNGGQSFHPQFVVSDQVNPDGLVSPGGGSADDVLDRASNLLFTTNGGDQGAASTLKITASPKHLTKSGSVVISGTLGPASGFEDVVVAARYAHSTVWTFQDRKVDAHGKFTASFNHVPKGTTEFVAQWLGDFQSAGAGTTALTYTIGPTHR